MAIVVVIKRAQEARALVHWAALLARARSQEVVAVHAVARDGEPTERDVPLGEEPGNDDALGAAADAIRLARDFFESLPPRKKPEEPEEEEADAPRVPDFRLVRLEGPDPVASILELTKKAGAELLVLGLAEKLKGGRLEQDPVLQLFRRAPAARF